MANLPRLTVSEFNTKSHCGKMQYVDIDILRFVMDEAYTNIVVQILEGENFVYFDEFEPSRSGKYHFDLLIMAQEWIIKHVNIA